MSWPNPSLTRRQLLSATAVGVGALSGWARLADAATRVAPQGSDLGAIEHVVILIQENRSFDHYFGTYRGVRGFDDHARSHLGSFAQPFAAQQASSPRGLVLPFHMDASQSAGSCNSDISHAWDVQHRAWNHGRMDGFVTAHLGSDGAANAPMTMGYHTRADLPFLYALADSFTICDHYHSSILGPTTPNRLYSMTGTVDPDGKAGGPVIENPGADASSATGKFSWQTMPEVLQDHGVSWKVYNQAGTNNNVLSLFKAYRDPTSPLLQNALLPTFPAEFQADVAAGTLPQVSWVLAPMLFDEHPPSPLGWGEWITGQVVSTLVNNPGVWAKTALFVTFDENGGMFDHVAPPVAPPGTPGEYLRGPLPDAAGGFRGPIGLGFRVPALVVSPFSRGGYVCSDTFDHTSLLRFLETRFDVRAPNISAWRRKVTGDLTSTLGMKSPDATVPTLPDTTPVLLSQTADCGPGGLVAVVEDNAGSSSNPGPVYPLPSAQHMPSQEPGHPRRRRT